MPKRKSPDTSEKYNDPNFDYTKYWVGRDYENAAEEIAIKRLLKGRHFKSAVDIGGGYGRLCPLLEQYSDQVTLAEPSAKQLNIAEHFLVKHKKVKLVKLNSDKFNFSNKSVDLLTMVRVMHHLPDPNPEFSELHRILKDDGYLILEVANSTHFLNRIRSLLKVKKVPEEPIDIRTRGHRNSETIPFVNHNPKTVVKELAHNGFKVEKILSVSNLRNPVVKNIVPTPVLVLVEKLFQPVLAKSFFGPSIFFLVKKAK